MDDFEQRSASGRLLLRRGASCPEPKGYYVYLDGDLVDRKPTLAAARLVFRSLAEQHDPPQPVGEDPNVWRQYIAEQQIARFYAERSVDMPRAEGGRTKRKAK